MVSADLHRPRRVLVLSFLAACSVHTASRPVHAQSQVEGEFTVQRFDPAPGPRNFFTTRGVRTDGEMAFSAGLFANYAYKPFVVSGCSGADPTCSDPQDILVVENLITGDALASLTPIPRLQLGLKIPVTWAKGQGIDEDATAAEDGIKAVGMGDAQLEAKYRLYGEVKDPFVVGVGAFGTAPLGKVTAEGSYIGDETPTAGIRAIFDGDAGPFSFGGNLVGVWRGGDAHVGETHIGSEFRYGVAAGLRIGPVVRIVADTLGSTRFSTNAGENTLEGDLGLQVTPLGSPLTISAGAGTALVDGIGAPDLRVFLGVVLAFEKSDKDSDGITDNDDKCPTDVEDVDGYEDSDGCPDQDNDLDAIVDAADKCPMRPEDADGVEDTDGCPETDNDKDGLADESDRCPDKAENKNGFQDDDGCPDVVDTDNDGLVDDTDKCKDEASRTPTVVRTRIRRRRSVEMPG